MTPLLSTKDFAELGAPNLVYVRPLKVRDISGGQPVQAGLGVKLSPDQILYGVYGADGERLAVMLERDEAIAAAVAHELSPVSVH